MLTNLEEVAVQTNPMIPCLPALQLYLRLSKFPHLYFVGLALTAVSFISVGLYPVLVTYHS